MEDVAEKSLNRSPEGTWSQISEVIRNEFDLRLLSTGSYSVGAANCGNVALDAEALSKHFEFQKTGRLDDCDLFHQIPSSIQALHGCTHARLIALGSQWERKQGAQDEWRTRRDFFIRQHTLPDLFGISFKENRGRYRL